jgi:hypothetical protein
MAILLPTCEDFPTQKEKKVPLKSYMIKIHIAKRPAASSSFAHSPIYIEAKGLIF